MATITTEKVLQWAKLIVPVLLSWIGWYVAQTVAPLDLRITTLEGKMQDNSTAHGDILKRIDANQNRFEQCIPRTEVYRALDSIQQDIREMRNGQLLNIGD